MNLDVVDLAAGMAQGLCQMDSSIVAKAQNLAWEECVSDVRRRFFEDEGFSGRGAQWSDLADRHHDYVQLYVNTDANPHTFEPALNPASLSQLDEDQILVRVERLERALDNSIYTFDDIVRAHDSRDLATLTAFAGEWNNVRDRRPAFATFLRQVQQEVESPDWAELLRDRLGLAHFQPTGEGIPVALMAYPVGDVLREAGAVSPFTTPTVLDSPLWEHYFPAPKEIPFGRAMALSVCDSDEDLVAEILHSRVSYTGGHFGMVGTITSSVQMLPTAELRAQHLLALQLASGRDDFGR